MFRDVIGQNYTTPTLDIVQTEFGLNDGMDSKQRVQLDGEGVVSTTELAAEEG